MKILSFGEILFDIIEGKPYLGGAPLNFAAHLAQCGEEAYIFSSIGTDELGDKALTEVKGLGVKTSFIKRDEVHATGTVSVVLKNGQPDYTINENVAYDFIDLEGNEELMRALNFDVLYFGTLAQRNEHSASSLQALISKKGFKQIFYDVNLRKDGYTKKILQDSLQKCSILKLNDEEVNVLSEMFYQKALTLELFLEKIVSEYNIDVVIVTAGEKGCYIYQSKQLSFVEGYPVQVIDTIGAGDSFSAAFIYHYLKYRDAAKAAEVANQLGSYVAGSRGAIPTYSQEIKKVLGLKEANKSIQ